ncbi:MULTISPECIES: hypothetical protein [Bacillales]|uniref:Uncharacterized protein n=1 Tax=Lacicoccus qingdaonensis TaxID=576118 RepID=A0A1G9JDE6_9BACL|nr:MULTISPECIES: hypothetical protein [Salinicoccus]SDL35411.1 hypothetical protein SAMN05216216_1488 [Salinicoccus qingdaonensis]
MISKRYDFDEDTVSKIKTIKQAKDIKTEKEVLIRALDHYLLSEMIEHESIEFKTLQKMNEIQDDIQRLNSKMNHVDLGVSINNLFLASDFEIKKHPKAIINRDTLDGYYFSSAKKEIQKMIREKDNENRMTQAKNDYRKSADSEISNQAKKDIDDDWLNV